MPLIKCPDCSELVSDQAPACINCGRPMEARYGRSASGPTPDVGSRQVRDEIKAKYDDLYPNDPVVAAEKTHEERLVLARRLRSEGRYTPDEYREFLRASELELQRDIGDRGALPRWQWSRIASFNSRTRPNEFLAAVGIALGATFAAGAINAATNETDPSIGVVATLVGLGIWVWLFWGGSVNRLHDMGRAGWFTLLYLIPLVNFGVLIWLLVSPGDAGVNRWGPPVRGTPKPHSASRGVY